MFNLWELDREAEVFSALNMEPPASGSYILSTEIVVRTRASEGVRCRLLDLWL